MTPVWPPVASPFEDAAPITEFFEDTQVTVDLNVSIVLDTAVVDLKEEENCEVSDISGVGTARIDAADTAAPESVTPAAASAAAAAEQQRRRRRRRRGGRGRDAAGRVTSAPSSSDGASEDGPSTGDSDAD